MDTWKSLSLYRDQLDQIDAQMAELFVKRMHIVKKIHDQKTQIGLPIRDEAREEEMLRSRGNQLSDLSLASYYACFLKQVIQLSCEYQEEMQGGLNE